MTFYLRITFWAAVLTLFGSFLHYTLPQWDIVRVTGVYEEEQDFVDGTTFWNNVRVDASGNPIPRHVQFIQSIRPDGSPSVYRNQDTGWGWPPYFKFDTANLQAEATNYISTSETPKWVGIKHYGWRIPYLSAFPNAVRIKQVEGPDTVIIPWVTIGLLVLIIMVIWFITARWLKFKHRYITPSLDSMDAWADSVWLKLTGKEPDVTKKD